jgi:hypothetical protein
VENELNKRNNYEKVLIEEREIRKRKKLENKERRSREDKC